MKVKAMYAQLKRLCRKAGVPIQPRTGVHSIRRSVDTALFERTDLKELTIKRFLRWAESGFGLGVMPSYVRTPKQATDAEVLANHLYFAMWK